MNRTAAIGLGIAAALAVPTFPACAPPLDLEPNHPGYVIAHVDVFGALGWHWPGDVARIRVTDVGRAAVVWDVRATSGVSECWNGCWNLTLRAGENPASFKAGSQQFQPLVPEGAPSFSLARDVRYRIQVWNSKGREAADEFSIR
jgi:hypothetical protein